MKKEAYRYIGQTFYQNDGKGNRVLKKYGDTVYFYPGEVKFPESFEKIENVPPLEEPEPVEEVKPDGEEKKKFTRKRKAEVVKQKYELTEKPGGWYDVVNTITGEKLNVKSLRKEDALDLIADQEVEVEE